MNRLLNGVRIVDLSHVIAGPMASHYLAQLGGEVVKIEVPAGGDVMRSKGATDGDTPSAFAAINVGKQSVAIDIRRPEGAEVVRRLAARADIFIENFRPGVVHRRGLGFADIAGVKPDIVYCSISGFGQHGTWSTRGAYDHVIQALTGMMMMSGSSEQAPPTKVGFPVIDITTGIIAALAMVAALRRRDADGRAQYLDCSMVDASLMLMYPHACEFLSHGIAPGRAGNKGFSGSPGADTFRCRDGWLAVAANTAGQFRKLARLLQLEELCRDDAVLDVDAFEASDGAFVVARDPQRAQQILACALAGRQAAAMELALNEAGVPAARVRTIGEYLRDEHPQQGLPPNVQFEQAGTTVRTPGLGFRSGHWDSTAPQKAPALGEHTRRWLGEAGLSSLEIDALLRQGVAA